MHACPWKCNYASIETSPLLLDQSLSPPQAQLAAQRAEAEAVAARSLQFIDRVMADKEALAGAEEGFAASNGTSVILERI